MHSYSQIKVSAPGSIMLMGEHAVLFGEPAIACAVDKYMHISLLPRTDRQVLIRSALADYAASLDKLTDEPRLSFVLAAVGRLSAQLPAGFELIISSEFSHTVGLGSSAAVTAGVTAALLAYAGLPHTPEAVFDHALATVHQVQGRGSGTDLAASVYGGLIRYTVTPRSIETLPGLPPLSLYYAGYKTRTPVVLEQVAQAAEQQPELYAGLYRLMGQASERAVAAIKQQDWPQLGQLFNIYQGLMDALGVTDQALAQMIYRLREDAAVQGSKISGSGLGDCVLALGNSRVLESDYERIPVAVSAQGVELEYH